MKYREIGKTTMLAPLPCALISCMTDSGPNIMTVAWTGIVNTKPPMVSISVKPERYSHDFLVSTGVFCLHPGDREHIRAVDLCGVHSGRDHDKFRENGFVPMETGLENAPGIDGMPLCIPCRVLKVIPLGSHDLFLASIEKILVREDLIDAKGSVHLERAGLVAYSHGLYQELGAVLGFFGFSVARRETYLRRMQPYTTGVCKGEEGE